MKHKHSEVIKAFVDGIQCEFWCNGDNDWLEINCLDTFDSGLLIRIKPEPKPDVVRYGYISSPNMRNINLTFCSFDIDNVKLIWDGETGELKSVEVIK
jgi:hypothetical protein